MENTLEIMNSRVGDTEHISYLEDRIMEIIPSEQQKDKFLNENILRYLWDNIRLTSIHFIGYKSRRERRRLKTYEMIIKVLNPKKGNRYPGK